MIYQSCEHCGAGVTDKRRRTCSSKCVAALRAARNKANRVIKECPHCKENFSLPPYKAGQECCSQPCARKHRAAQNRNTIPCEECGTVFTSPKNQKRRFCSKLCANQYIASSRSVKGAGTVTTTCEVCEKPFVHKKVRPRKMCSRQCALKKGRRTAPYSERKLKGLKKTGPCVECGVDVVVFKSMANCHIRCETHKKKRKEFIKNTRTVRDKGLNTPADKPYQFYTLKALSCATNTTRWVANLFHEGTHTKLKVPLEKYILETRIGRLLRDDEKVVFVDGNVENCTPDNIKLGVKELVLQPAVSWFDREG